ncbi:alpha-E domain-containing protein [Rhizobium sp. NRK18]|jgi:uncharacterized alpha-E superfamily protein|uniref:alpha-E domain-containing protein n=1 Tax=Rhizobium sp. NRK18 TaxID=2964667 RepID=UPI0021C26E22|nr:alpha-E domain-containing protein [Rhizobium sp. NRK18]MCQ2003501.1 alpha-E domain-containing protein [Rhizobium sp. NRK18]
MLGRTANGLYWMSRYLERAENTARLVDAGLRLSLTRSSGADDEWESILHSADVKEAYFKKHDKVTAADVIDFMLRDRDNTSSVINSMEFGRNNGRMVRTALTRDTWEALNECWLETRQLLSKRISPAVLPDVIETIKRRISLIGGMFFGTMLRDENYNFAQLGTFIERADNTSRILDVKYYVLLPSITSVGSSLDSVQWESILRSVSAQRSYSWVYQEDYSPANIADFLILNVQMPRSLAYCYEKLCSNLNYLALSVGDRHPAHSTAEAMRNQLRTKSIAEIMDQGLHEFLDDFITQNNQLGMEISSAYRFY